MASKRAHRRRSCEGKKRYETKADANVQGRRGLQVYKCDFGQHFHNGHPSRKNRQAMHAKRRRE